MNTVRVQVAILASYGKRVCKLGVLPFALFSIIILVFNFLPMLAHAYMTSETYVIYADQVGGSGNQSSADGTELFDTFGTLIHGGEVTSESFRAQDALPGQLPPDHMSFTFAGGALSFDPDPLSTTQVSTASFSATVATTARGGYTLAVTADGGFTNGTGGEIGAVSDGEVSVGVEEYGIAVTGTDASFADDQALSTGNLGIAGRDGWTSYTGEQTDGTLKASIDGASLPGSYTQTVMLTVTGKF